MNVTPTSVRFGALAPQTTVPSTPVKATIPATQAVQFGHCGLEAPVAGAVAGTLGGFIKKRFPKLYDKLPFKKIPEDQMSAAQKRRRTAAKIMLPATLMAGTAYTGYESFTAESQQVDAGFREMYYTADAMELQGENDFDSGVGKEVGKDTELAYSPALLENYRVLLDRTRDLTVDKLADGELKTTLAALPIQDLPQSQIASLLDKLEDDEQLFEYNQGLMNLIKGFEDDRFSPADLAKISVAANAVQDDYDDMKWKEKNMPTAFMFLATVNAGVLSAMQTERRVRKELAEKKAD